MPDIICYKAHRGRITPTYQVTYNSLEEVSKGDDFHTMTIPLSKAIVFTTKCHENGKPISSILTVDRSKLPSGNVDTIVFAIYNAACDIGTISQEWLMDQEERVIIGQAMIVLNDGDKTQFVGPFQNTSEAVNWAIGKFGEHYESLPGVYTSVHGVDGFEVRELTSHLGL